MGVILAWLPGKKWLALALAVFICLGGSWAWGYRKGAADNAASTLALQARQVDVASSIISKVEQLRQIVITIQAEKFDKVRVKYVEYVKSDHPRITFDAERVRIKAAAVEAANASSGANRGDLQAPAAIR